MSECQRDGSLGRDWMRYLQDEKALMAQTESSVITGHSVHICGNPWKNWTFLRLQTGDGLEGVGECSLNGFAKTTEACFHELSRYFVGQYPQEYATITRRMLTDLYSDAGQLHRGIVAAVEMACLDILGKRVGLPAHAILGGKVRTAIPAYGNGWYRVERTPGGFERATGKALAFGHTALKVDPFGADTSPLSEAQRGNVFDICQNVSRCGSSLILECHQRLDYPDVLWVYDVIVSRQWLWIEEPLPWYDTEGLMALANRSPVPIGIGENFTDIRQFHAIAVRTRNVIFQPDVMNLGGITKALEVCRLAESCGIRVCPHDAQGPVSRAACVQLAALSPAIWMLEDFDPWQPEWTREIADTFRATNGVIGFGTHPPGLGVTIHWDKVSAHPYEPNGWVPLFETGWERRRDAN